MAEEERKRKRAREKEVELVSACMVECTDLGIERIRDQWPRMDENTKIRRGNKSVNSSNCAPMNRDDRERKQTCRLSRERARGKATKTETKT